ncbi:hypothetical protein [Streptomyces sp. CA-253872]|uniref:hypothetical protein n=1 Tax=Streptomyces sp. CA-253872 TaxID=3240067 RepID=UPI003D9506E8
MTSVYTELTKEAGSLGGPDGLRDLYFDKGREVAIAAGAALLAKAKAENAAMLAKGRMQGLVGTAVVAAGAVTVWAVKRRAARRPIVPTASPETAARPESGPASGGAGEA